MANKPVMITMFAKTWKSDGPHYGDPAMSLIIPEPQYASDYTWSSVRDPTGAEFNNKVSVIIDKDEVSGLLLDEEPVTWEENVVRSQHYVCKNYNNDNEYLYGAPSLRNS